MKIGILCYPTYGGSGVVATELGLALAKRGHEIHFITYDQPVRLQTWHDNVYFHAVDVMSYPLFKYPPYTLAATSRIIEVVKAHRLELLHAHYAIPHTICALLARQILGTPLGIVTTLHGTDITLVGTDPSFFEVTRYSIEQSDAVTTVSQYLKNETIRQMQVDREYEVIHNFVDPQRFRPSWDNHQPCVRKNLVPGGERIIMHISNFRPVKRVRDVVRTFAELRRAVTAKLIMIGDGQDLPEARAQAADLGLADDVLFLGQQDCIESLLPCADLLLLPSEHESFGLVALEAMSCGVPVISTRGSGVEEVVTHGKDGSLHPVGDCVAMGAAAVEILLTPGRHETMRRAARAASLRFPIDEIVPLYEALYTRVLAKRPTPVIVEK